MTAAGKRSTGPCSSKNHHLQSALSKAEGEETSHRADRRASTLTAGAFTGHNNLPIDCRRMPEDSQFKATLKYLPSIASWSLPAAYTLKLPQSLAGHKGQDRGRVSHQGRACSWKAVHSKFTHSTKKVLTERRHSYWKITLAGGRGWPQWQAMRLL